MPLNIKDDAVHEQARKLAALTGVSITAAVREAIAERLRHVEAELAAPAHERSGERLLELGRRFSAINKHLGMTSDHSDLYDELGLPK